jgi:hypothetical protein
MLSQSEYKGLGNDGIKKVKNHKTLEYKPTTGLGQDSEIDSLHRRSTIAVSSPGTSFSFSLRG